MLATLNLKNNQNISFTRNLNPQAIRIIFLLLIFTVFIFGLVFIGVKLNSQKQDTRSLAALDSGTYNLILKLTRDKDTSEVKVEKAIINDGFIPKQNLTNSDNSGEVLEQLVDNKIVTSHNLVFNNYINGDDFTKSNPPDSRLKLPQPGAYLSIKYYPASQLKIRNKLTGKIQNLDKSLINLAFAQKTAIPKKEVIPQDDTGISGDGYLDIVYISSHYTDFNQFHSDADALANYLLGLYPFSAFAQKINIIKLDNTEDLGCHYDGTITGLLTCDYTLVMNVASQVPYDTVVVIENNNNYGGSGILGANLAVTYRNVNELAKQTAAHEMGHSFGYLFDEYDYGYNYNSPEPPPWANCSFQPCKWSGVPGTGCFNVCGYSNLFRPTYNDSLMRTLTPDHGDKYGPVSEEQLYSVLQSYIPTLPTPTKMVSPTPTVSPTPFPMIIDNLSPQAKAVGNWIESTSSPGYYATNYQHDNNESKGSKSFTFTPVFKRSGHYALYLRWTQDPNRASNVPVDIISDGGTRTSTLNIDQRANGGVWRYMGYYSFIPNKGDRIVIRTNGTNGYVIADAVWTIYVRP